MRTHYIQGINSYKHLLSTPIALAVALWMVLVNAPTVSAQTCAADIGGGPLTCTATDVRIASLEILDVIDPCTSADDTATVSFRVELIANAAERYDIGMFIATDGGDALTGRCDRDYLPAPLSATSGPNSGTSRVFPFYDAEGSGDRCGDIEQDVPTFRDWGLVTTIACKDVEAPFNQVDPICTLTSWDNNRNTQCTGSQGTTPIPSPLPGTPAKCRQECIPIALQIGPTDLAVTKSVNSQAVIAGDRITYTIEVVNLSPVSVSNVIVSDTLNALLLDPVATSSQGSCTITPNPQTDPSPYLVECEMGSFGASPAISSTAFVTVSATISTGAGSATIPNTACVENDQQDQDPSNNCDTVTVGPPAPMIDLIKTVSRQAGVCGASNTISVGSGTQVYYCYRVRNTGNVVLDTHTLTDTHLGLLLSGHVESLAPGESTIFTTSAVISESVTNVAVWTAASAEEEVSATDNASATVTTQVPNPAIVLTKTVGTEADVCATTQTITVTAGTRVYYCYTVENIGNVVFDTHTLTDTQLGTLMEEFSEFLDPGQVMTFITSTVVNETITNIALWTASSPLGEAEDTDSADTDDAVVIVLGPTALDPTDQPHVPDPSLFIPLVKP